MKKILLLFIVFTVTPFVGGILYLTHLYQSNPTMLAPYSYRIDSSNYKGLEVDAPIVIIGDKMATRLGQFTNQLSKEISKDLSRPIKVVSLAANGEGIHRTLAKVKSLPKLPLFLIYMGGSEETYESKFSNQEIPKILKNVSLYENDAIHTMLMLFPELSRFIYRKVHLTPLAPEVAVDKNEYPDSITQKRNEIEFKFYKYHLSELFSYAREHNSMIFAISTPINLDAPPKKSCDYSIDNEGKVKLQQTLEFVRQQDFKSAYNVSKELVMTASSNAQVHFIHGKICKKLGRNDEAIKHLRYSSAFDCQNWRATPVYNAILKEVAKEQEVLFYNFDSYLIDNWRKNITFEDDTYPQNFYMNKMLSIIASKIRQVLKL